jgi:hypothetical protein
MVRLPDRRSANRLPTFSRHVTSVFFLLASISSTRRMRRSFRSHSYISLTCYATSHSPTASWGIPTLYNTLTVQNSPAGATEPVPAPGPALNHTKLPETEPAGLGTNCARSVECSWPALLATLSFILTSNLFNLTRSPTPLYDATCYRHLNVVRLLIHPPHCPSHQTRS